MKTMSYVVCRDCGTRWETDEYQVRDCINPDCSADWLALPMFAEKVHADNAARQYTDEREAGNVAKAAALRLRELAEAIDGALGLEEEGDAAGWLETLRDVADSLDPPA